jgi:hypothetical protein
MADPAPTEVDSVVVDSVQTLDGDIIHADNSNTSNDSYNSDSDEVDLENVVDPNLTALYELISEAVLSDADVDTESLVTLFVEYMNNNHPEYEFLDIVNTYFDDDPDVEKPDPTDIIQALHYIRDPKMVPLIKILKYKYNIGVFDDKSLKDWLDYLADTIQTDENTVDFLDPGYVYQELKDGDDFDYTSLISLVMPPEYAYHEIHVLLDIVNYIKNDGNHNTINLSDNDYITKLLASCLSTDEDGEEDFDIEQFSNIFGMYVENKGEIDPDFLETIDV